MWRMRVVHSTGYAYESPVTASYNEARLTPRSDARQNVILSRIETVPATRSYRYTDYWGTVVTAFDLHAPHTELTVTASSVVETERPEMSVTTFGWEQLNSEAVVDRYDELLRPSPYAPANRTLATAGRRIAKAHEPREAVAAAAQWVRDELELSPRGGGPHEGSAIEALGQHKGSCPDFAHLTLILLRSMGIPSRYVSGYLHPKSNAAIGKTVAGHRHAWVQAWTGSWRDVDPTTAAEITEQYVSVGVGRDYHDIPVLNGIYSGTGATDLDVVVELCRLA